MKSKQDSQLEKIKELEKEIKELKENVSYWIDDSKINLAKAQQLKEFAYYEAGFNEKTKIYYRDQLQIQLGISQRLREENLNLFNIIKMFINPEIIGKEIN